MSILSHLNFFLLGAIVFGVAFLGLMILVRFSRSPKCLVGKVVRIPSRKSLTDAIQLGGAPVSLAIGIGLMIIFFFVPMEQVQSNLAKAWLLCSSLVFVYGYLDDKFELRPIIKLMAQLCAINVFAVYASLKISPHYSTLLFLVLSIWGMGVVNGINLLDGLDTLTIKLSTVTYGAYIILGFYHQVTVVSYVAMICLASLFAFYFYNREPAKVHLGEIGGAYLGFTMILLSSLLSTGSHISTLSNIGIVLMPLSLPMVEVGISFSRRILNKKSPFKGDRLHIHHILKNYFHFSVTVTTWVMSVAYLGIMIIALALGFIHGLLALTMVTVGLISLSIIVGRNHWMITNDIGARSLTRCTSRDQITLIEPSISDDFQLLIDDSSQRRSQVLQ